MGMGSARRMIVFGVMIILGVAGRRVSAQTESCPKTFNLGGENKVYSICNELSNVEASLSWTYYPSNGSIEVAFRAAPAASGGWIGWGINPTSEGMLGTQALIAFLDSSGSPYVNTYDLQSTVNPPSPGNISISTSNLQASYDSSSGKFTIFAELKLPDNKTTVNQAWNTGRSVEGVKPQPHDTNPAHTSSYGSIDLATGTSSSSSSPRQTLKRRHGVINVVGWGIMLPIGAMIARYMRTFESADPAWFYMHIFCQCSGYILGVSGWAVGLKLGSDSRGIEYGPHRKIGITLFVLGTLQVFALLLRPNKKHKLRIFWNVYHGLVGYTVILLSVINIFKGFDILKPAQKWKHAYIAVIVCLAAIAIVLETVTQIIHFKRKKSNSPNNTVIAMADNNKAYTSSQQHV